MRVININTLVMMFVIMFTMSCSKKDGQVFPSLGFGYMQSTLPFRVQDPVGRDLLAPSSGKIYNREDITIGKFDDKGNFVSIEGQTNAGGIEIEKQDGADYYVIVIKFPIPKYIPNIKQTVPFYLQFKGNDVDKFEIDYMYTQGETKSGTLGGATLDMLELRLNGKTILNKKDEEVFVLIKKPLSNL